MHIHHHLGVEGRLAAYELVGPTWQLNVINVHVPFGDATETFLEHVMEAYRQLAVMGPTVIIGDFNAAPSGDNRRGRQTPEDAAVQVAMQHLGLQDLTASLLKRYPEPHDHGGVYNRSPCAHQPHVRRGRRPMKPGESPAGACPLP